MDGTTPQVLLLLLAQHGLFDNMYGQLYAEISAKFSTVRKNTVDDAYAFLSSTNPSAVLVADGGVALARNAYLQKSLVRYAGAGGTVIFGCLFSSFVSPPDLGHLFKRFELGWKSGDYHRTTFALNDAVKPVFGEQIHKKLEKSYSMKSLHLQYTPSTAKVYVPAESSRIESSVFPTGPVDQRQTPAVFHNYSQGFLGYIGDVNNERGSQALLFAMLEVAVRNQSSNTTDTTELPPLSPTNPGCAVCGILIPALKCGACHKTQYCSSACQRADWGSHKEGCKKEQLQKN